MESRASPPDRHKASSARALTVFASIDSVRMPCMRRHWRLFMCRRALPLRSNFLMNAEIKNNQGGNPEEEHQVLHRATSQPVQFGQVTSTPILFLPHPRERSLITPAGAMNPDARTKYEEKFRTETIPRREWRAKTSNSQRPTTKDQRLSHLTKCEGDRR